MKIRLAGKSATSRCSLPIILASLLTVFGPCISAATYYVSTTGSDSNPCPQAAPFRHISKGAFERHRRGGALSGVAGLELRLQQVSRR